MQAGWAVGAWHTYLASLLLHQAGQPIPPLSVCCFQPAPPLPLRPEPLLHSPPAAPPGLHPDRTLIDLKVYRHSDRLHYLLDPATGYLYAAPEEVGVAVRGGLEFSWPHGPG